MKTTTNQILILDFGGQYSQLIAKNVRACGVYCEIKSYHTPLEKIKSANPAGIILTGGPHGVYLEDSPRTDRALFELGIPILGICYGAQLMAYLLEGEVCAANAQAEYGKTTATLLSSSLFASLPTQIDSWMSHTDFIKQLPSDFSVVATTAKCPVAAMENQQKKLYALQFHPEVSHTEHGQAMLRNFVLDICGCVSDWNMKNFCKNAIAEVQDTVKDGKVLLALSGGVDSSVLAALLAKAIGKQLTCIFVDHGLLRKNEAEEVASVFAAWDIEFIRVDAAKRFFTKLAGVTNPEEKRKIIGEEFIRVFEEEARKIGTVDFFAQGTIYPDVIESGAGHAAKIKSHHNVGGLPEHIDFKQLIEPLRLLFKDEVRALGEELGLDHALVYRQPFPGPGLAVRIIGEVTKQRVAILQDADAIFRQEIQNVSLHTEIHQYFAVLTSMKSVGVMGDGRTYDYTLALRAVQTNDFMTADFAKIPYDLLAIIATRIVNEVSHINRIVYDITTKPPATIEWE